MRVRVCNKKYAHLQINTRILFWLLITASQRDKYRWLLYHQNPNDRDPDESTLAVTLLRVNG